MRIATFYFFLVLTSINIFKKNINAQTTHPFEIGLNAGAAWLQSDVKVKRPGFGMGYTVGNMYLQNLTSPIDIGWRIRYLKATAYGQDLNKSTGISNNTLFNGTRDSVLNYKETSGFVFQNYLTDISEWSAELVIGANKLRESTRIYPYVFGGAGLVYSITHTNQLDNHGKQYNYQLIDSVSNGGSTSNQSLKQLYDGTYETAAEGSEHPKWKFMPSLGLGVGFQVSKAFSIGIEHKMTWALNDVLDGQKWNNNNVLTGTNDIYHYSSLWMKISFGKNPKKQKTTSPPPTNTNQTVQLAQTNTPKPSIVITNPVTNPYITNQRIATLTAQINNINSTNEINLKVNGISSNTYSYDKSSHKLAYSGPLQDGNNTFVITASNQHGTDVKSTTIVFNSKASNTTTMLPAPVITITSPTANPFNTSLTQASVNAVIQNINTKNQVQVFFNGSSNSNFTYTENTHSLAFNTNLVSGNNIIKIIATNSSGSDTKSQTIVYERQVVVPKPEITITNPSTTPYSTNTKSINMEANISNISSENDISIKVNGSNFKNFSFNASTKKLTSGITLKNGDNTIVITATNSAGTASKTQVVKYNLSLAQTTSTQGGNLQTPVSNNNNENNGTGSLNNQSTALNNGNKLNNEQSSADSHNALQASTGRTNNHFDNTVRAPIVTFTTPSSSTTSSNTLNYHVEGTVLNVSGKNEISVKLNNTTVNSFNYNTQNHKISFDIGLMRGTNQISISGTNSAGSDSKTITVNFVGS